MKETQFIDDKVLRDKSVEHYEVLEKVKHMNLIEGLNMMTMKQIAEYFECSIHTIEIVFKRNKRFLSDIGSKLFTYKELEECEYLTVESREKGKIIARTLNGIEIVYNNRGLRLFNVDGIINIGLLLRDNEVSQRIKECLFGTDKIPNYRKEIRFLDKLEQVLLPLEIKGIRQYITNDKYRVDFYIPDYGSYTGLAIEYDEDDHKGYSYESQELRQEKIEDELQCGFLRLSDSNSDEYNIGLVMKYLLEDKEQTIKILQSPTEMFQQTTPKIKR